MLTSMPISTPPTIGSITAASTTTSTKRGAKLLSFAPVRCTMVVTRHASNSTCR
jgi:hypothetical protein